MTSAARIEQIKNRLAPLAIQGMIDAIVDSGGVEGFLKGSPEFFGVGAQTFDTGDSSSGAGAGGQRSTPVLDLTGSASPKKPSARSTKVIDLTR